MRKSNYILRGLSFIVGFLIIILTLFGCNSTSQNPKDKDDISNAVVDNKMKSEYGNEIHNIERGEGKFVKYGEWIYYGAGKNLMKMKTDGTEQTSVYTDEEYGFEYLNIVDDWVYYSGFSINKVKIDGAEKKTIYDPAYSIISTYVVDDYIYFLDVKNSSALTKIDINGNKKTAITDYGDISYVNVVGDWIYFVNNDDWTVYKIKTDGTSFQQLKDIKGAGLIIVDNTIYYCDNGIYTSDLNGENSKAILVDSKCDYLQQVEGDWIYFSQNDGKNGNILSRVKKDGSNVQDLQITSYDNYFLDSVIIYSVGDNRNPTWFMANLDGSSKRQITLE